MPLPNRRFLLVALGLASSCQCTTDDAHSIEAGAIVDAGTSMDAGTHTDGGVAHDAGAVDAGVASASNCEQGGWCWQRPIPFGHSLFASWGSGPSDVWAVGAYGAIAHYDGANWRLFSGVTRATLYGVWGSGPQSVWAVGEKGTVLHFNGTAWAAESALTSVTLRSVHGTSSSSVYVVGDDEVVLYFDGMTWAKLPPVFNLGFTINLHAIFAFANGEAWAAGSYPYGAAHRSADGGWSVVSLTPLQSVTYSTIWGADSADVWMSGATGAATERWDGGVWKDIYPRSLDGGFDDAQTIAGSSANDVWFLGGWGESVGHWNGAQFSEAPELRHEPLTTGWVHDSGAGWAFGYGGRIAHKTALAGPWSIVGGSPEGSYDTMYALAVINENDIWMGGRLGVAHWDGVSWTDAPMATTRNRVDVFDMYAAAPNDIWLVGYSTTAADGLQHFDGTSWRTVDNPGSGSYTALWGSGPSDVWVKGQSELLHFDGHAWSTQNAPAGDLFAGTASTDLWVAGTSGKTYQFNGTSWAPHPTGVSEDPSSLVLVDSSDVWLSTFGGHLLRWNGTVWAAVGAPAELSAPNFIRAMKVDSHGDVWVTGSAGDVWRYSNSQWYDEGATGVLIFEIAFTPTGKTWLVGENGAALVR